MKKQHDLEGVMERLTRMIQVIGETPALLEKTRVLYRTPLGQRDLVLQGIIKHMMETGEASDIIEIFRLFSVPQVYMGAMEALHDCGYLER